MGIKELRSMDLHDSTMELFQINLLEKEIIINLSSYNDDANEYFLRKLIFSDAAFIEMGCFNTDDISSNEIYSVEISEQLNCHHIKFVLLLGTGRPSINLSFSFSSFKLITEH